jgi:hypothetical protein
MEDCWAANYSFGAINGDLVGAIASCSGVAKMRCFGTTHCFGATNGSSVAMRASCEGTLIECRATTYSFGFSRTEQGECAASLVDCSSQGYCYGCTLGAVGSPSGIFSGRAYRVISTGDYCFGSNSADTTLGDVDAAAILEDCESGEYSFGALGATVNGTFRRCKANSGSFGQATSAQTAMLMEDCEITDIKANESPEFDGVATLLRCRITVRTQVNEPSVGIHDSGPRLYDCDFYGDTSNPNIAYVGGGQLATISVAHCRMNTGLGASLANNIDTPYNVVDADYAC